VTIDVARAETWMRPPPRRILLILWLCQPDLGMLIFPLRSLYNGETLLNHLVSVDVHGYDIIFEPPRPPICPCARTAPLSTRRDLQIGERGVSVGRAAGRPGSNVV